jgi:hypothetical protein
VRNFTDARYLQVPSCPPLNSCSRPLCRRQTKTRFFALHHLYIHIHTDKLSSVPTMATWQYLVTFEAEEDGKFYFAPSSPDVPKVGTSIQSFASPASLQDGNGVTRKIKKACTLSSRPTFSCVSLMD